MGCKAMDRVTWIRDRRLVDWIGLDRDLVNSARPGLEDVIKPLHCQQEQAENCQP
jgi:hypothetical protein